MLLVKIYGVPFDRDKSEERLLTDMRPDLALAISNIVALELLPSDVMIVVIDDSQNYLEGDRIFVEVAGLESKPLLNRNTAAILIDVIIRHIDELRQLKFPDLVKCTVHAPIMHSEYGFLVTKDYRLQKA